MASLSCQAAEARDRDRAAYPWPPLSMTTQLGHATCLAPGGGLPGLKTILSTSHFLKASVRHR